MRNPWLDIPLADYEAHMSLSTIGQSQLIASQLDLLVRNYRPRSVAIVGCAGGNGFDRLIDTSVSRVVGVDINSDYIEEARRRYEDHLPGLDLYVADIESAGSMFEPVDLLYAALVLEYVDLAPTMSVLRRHCQENGVLAVLTQLPHETIAHVSPSPYTSLRRLASGMRLIPQEELQQCARQAGFSPEDPGAALSAGGKHFSLSTFHAR